MFHSSLKNKNTPFHNPDSKFLFLQNLNIFTDVLKFCKKSRSFETFHQCEDPRVANNVEILKTFHKFKNSVIVK